MHDEQVNINTREKSPNMLQEMLHFTTILIVYHGKNSLENWQSVKYL